MTDLWILDVFRVEHVGTHPEEWETDQNNVDTEDHHWNFIFIIPSQETGGERDERNKHEEEGIDIGQHWVNIFGIDGDEEVMSSPVGEEEGKRENVREEDWQQLLDLNPQNTVTYMTDNIGHLEFKDEHRHHDGKDPVRELI